ncbi:hemolysin family protein [Cellulomonas sp. KRMCY2]|uniref:hemolysin family protein n=1 Tax=Cellulomonas sp. KRMCY2 TaxID=1304865 RepID=UPI00045EB77D|nr:hemolysin family protein [Cellulomonas sp. KRMCY2]
MTGAPSGTLAAIALLAIVLAALLSAGETAVLRLGRSALAELGGSTLPSARRARRIMTDPRPAAAAAGTVRVVAEGLAAVCVTVALGALWPRWWQGALASFVLVAAVGLTVVRLGPRTFGRRHPVGTLLVTSALVLGARSLTAPLHLATGAATDQHELTDDEIREMVDRVSESDHIEDDEREMFRSVLELGETITRAVMVPRTEMITLPSGTPLRKALSLFLRSGYSRVPVVGESVDDLIGVLYLKDVVRHRHTAPESDVEPVDALVRPPVFVPESKPVDDLLREMQKGAFHMAMVVDEFGGIAGLVTIEDALEEIVGELTDEHDHSGPEVEDLGDGTLRVPSRLPLDELGELFEVVVVDDDVDTVGGLLAKVIGKVPLAGSRAEVGGLELVADRVEGRRKQVSTVLVRRTSDPDRPEPTPHTSSEQGAHR